MSAHTSYQQLRSHLAYLKLGAAADALALALEAAERDKSGYTRFLHNLLAVYYTTAADLVARTAAAMDGRWANTMRCWAGPQLLIVDELGYLPMPGEAASHLFQFISRRYEHGSMILTTNRGIADWGHIFEDTTVATAILDRLLHHASVPSGEVVEGNDHRADSFAARSWALA